MRYSLQDIIQDILGMSAMAVAILNSIAVRSMIQNRTIEKYVYSYLK